MRLTRPRENKFNPLRAVRAGLARLRENKSLLRVALALGAVAVLGAGALIYSLTRPPDPLRLYQAGLSALESAASAQLTAQSSLTLSGGSQRLGMTIYGDIQREGSGETARLSAQLREDFAGAADEEVYFIDGMLYRSLGGQKTRQVMDYAAALNSLYIGGLDFPAEAVLRQELSPDAGGGRRLELLLDAQALREDLLERLAPWEDRQVIEEAGVVFGDALFNATLDKRGLLTERRLAFSATLGEGERAMSMVCDLLLSVEGINETVVTLPPDLGDYMLVLSNI
ncbi:MAG: hypothetical protein LBK98_06990 [Peptococcaceae bacterium]|nr:hypothetical protein [Peptococcaceae bacterium]